jgi:hypothetical protein
LSENTLWIRIKKDYYSFYNFKIREKTNET